MGQWRLIIEDVEQGNSGELLDWTLHFGGKENEKHLIQEVNRNPSPVAGVRTSYVVDMSQTNLGLFLALRRERNFHFVGYTGGPYYHFANYELVGDISGTKWHDIDGR